MTTPNEKLADEFIQRAIDVFGMAETEARILARDFAAEEDKRTLTELLALFLAASDPMARYYAVERILDARAQALERVRERMYRAIDRFTQNEGEFVSDTVGPVQEETPDNYVFTAAFIAALINRVLQRPLSGGDEKFDDIFKELVARDRARIERTFAQAFTGARGARWLTQALDSDFADTAETIQIVLHGMTQHARSVTLDLAMAAVNGSVKWISVLDGKTTAVCRSRSGKIYPPGVGPRPPAHVRCRSIVVPYFVGKGEYEEPKYEDWLRKQTPERVRQILGKTKGAMFLDGTLSLEDMVTAKGRELTLKEIVGNRGEA